MGKYLKMADVFVGEYKPKRRIDAWPPSRYGETLIELSGSPAQYAAHAINSHDELVELLQAHCKAQDDGANLARELDVLLNGEDGASIQASLCDIVAQVKKHGLSFNRVGELVEEVERLRDALQDAYLDGCHYGWEMSAEGYNAEHGGPNDGRLHNQFIESYSGEPYISE